MYYRIRREALLQFFGNLNKIVPECILTITEDGFDALHVDGGNVAMMHCAMTPVGFDIISEMGDPEGINIYGEYGIDIDKIIKFLKVFSGDVEFRIADNMVYLQSDQKVFTMRLLDVNSIKRVNKIPEIVFKSEVEIEGSDLVESLKSSGIVAEKVRFEIDPDVGQFRVIARGDEIFKNVIPTSAISGEYANTLFSLDYLTEVGKAITTADRVKVKLNTDNPLWVEFSHDNFGVETTYMLAPRIEAED